MLPATIPYVKCACNIYFLLSWPLKAGEADLIVRPVLILPWQEQHRWEWQTPWVPRSRDASYILSENPPTAHATLIYDIHGPPRVACRTKHGKAKHIICICENDITVLLSAFLNSVKLPLNQARASFQPACKISGNKLQHVILNWDFKSVATQMFMYMRAIAVDWEWAQSQDWPPRTCQIEHDFFCQKAAVWGSASQGIEDCTHANLD